VLGALPAGGAQIDLGELYASLARKQGGSLLKLLAAYATQDAAAAFRLAEVSGLDLPRQLPGIVISNADQMPFLSMAVEKLLLETDRTEEWALVLAEAGLTSRLVATLLDKKQPDEGNLAQALKKVGKRRRWDVPGITGRSLYTQILGLATSVLFTPNHKPNLLAFPRLTRLCAAPPPGKLGPWYRYPLPAGIVAAIATFALFHVPPLVSLVHLRHGARFEAALLFIHSLAPAVVLYLILFRGWAARILYRALINRIDLGGPKPDEAISAHRIFMYSFLQFLTRRERHMLSALIDESNARRLRSAAG
jgi:hypothetical protein